MLLHVLQIMHKLAETRPKVYGRFISLMFWFNIGGTVIQRNAALQYLFIAEDLEKRSKQM